MYDIINHSVWNTYIATAVMHVFMIILSAHSRPPYSQICSFIVQVRIWHFFLYLNLYLYLVQIEFSSFFGQWKVIFIKTKIMLHAEQSAGFLAILEDRDKVFFQSKEQACLLSITVQMNSLSEAKPRYAHYLW